MRKGQVALFMTLGVVLLLLVGILFFVFSDGEQVGSSQQSFATTQNIEFMIDECIRETGFQGLLQMGHQGNYVPDIPRPLQVNETSFWVYEHNNVMPILNSSADDFEDWFTEEFRSCVDFTQYPITVEEGKITTTVTYAAEQTIIDVHWPLNITRGDETQAFTSFTEVLNVRYRRMYERASNIVEAHFLQEFNKSNPLEFVDSRDFIIEWERFDGNSLLFTITDPNEFSGELYQFSFATNMNRSNSKRTASVTAESLRSPTPYCIFSPDRLAFVCIQNDAGIRFPDGTFISAESSASKSGDIYSWMEYGTQATREDVPYSVDYSTKGGSISLKGTQTTDAVWNLTYPIYHFAPGGLEFFNGDSGQAYPQPLVIYWDEEDNPNYGPMGLMYRGERSNGEWIPVKVEENYEENYIATNIVGFSEYSPVDCSFQQCREASVSATSEPDTLCYIMVAIMIIAIIAVVVTFGQSLALVIQAGGFQGGFMAGMSATFQTVFASIFSFGSTTAVSTAVTSGTALLSSTGLAVAAAAGTAILAAGVTFAGLTLMGAGDFGSDETSVNFVATCDQLVQAQCQQSGAFESGFGQITEQKLPSSGTTEHYVEGGEQQVITAVIEGCKKSMFSCKKCGLTCRVSYK